MKKATAALWLAMSCGSIPAQAQFTTPGARSTRTAEIRNSVAIKSSSQSRLSAEQTSWIIKQTRQELKKVSLLPTTIATASAQITTYAPPSQDALGYGQDWTPDDCERSIAAAEARYRLPPYLLHAIALTESGRNGRPSPVAMNVMGTAYYARSTNEMSQVVERYGSRSSIDVGCMQINLKFHGGRFRDWRSLLRPDFNAEYAALYLVELYRSTGTWSGAVGAYHSRTPWKSVNYACLVSRRYSQMFGSTRPGCGADLDAMAKLMYSTIGYRTG